MNELKCKECGTALVQGVKECPSCGCPIEDTDFESNTVVKENAIKKFNVMPIISLIFGIVVIFMGITVKNKEISFDTYTANHYDVDHAVFGADFYTEIYEAADIIADELNDINGGVEVISESMEAVANVICYSAGMVMIALGISVAAVSCNYIRKVAV